MPPPPPVEDLVRKAAAAPPGDERQRRFALLVRRTAAGADAVTAFTLLRKSAGGNRAALEYAAAVPEPLPAALVLLAADALHHQDVPVRLRLEVAGALLASVPDTPPAVGPVVRAVTAGLSSSKALLRMIELQSRVERCDALDRMVQAAEKAVKLKCPKCGQNFRRVGFVKHLWHAHKLAFEHGAAFDPKSKVGEAVTAAVQSDDPARIDRAFALTARHVPGSDPALVLQAVAARQSAAGHPVPDELTRSAADARSGLCPSCLAPVPDPLPPPPPPLAVSRSRLAGDGYTVEVADSPAGRTLRVVTPNKETTEAPPGERRFDPRTLGVIAGLPVLGVAAGLMIFPFITEPVLLALGSSMLGWLLYAAVRFTRPKLPRGERLAVDAAWRGIVPGLKVNKANARWLARLCRASADRGSPRHRSRTLANLVADAADAYPRGGAFVSLLAAARVLQVIDAADQGKDRTAGFVGVFEPFFRGELSAEYAESAADIAHTDDLVPGADAARLGVRLTCAAFAAGFGPTDLLRVLRFLPHLRVLCGTPGSELLKLRHVVWRWRNSEPWAGVGPAVPVCVLAESSPGACRRILAAHPDAVLRLTLPDPAEAELGEVVLTARGLVVAGKVLTDPDDEPELLRSPRGSGWMLALGAQRINLDRKVSPDTVALLSRWLRYRTTKLLPHADATDRGNPAVVRRVLAPLVRACPRCGAECVCRTGRVGEAWPVQ